MPLPTNNPLLTMLIGLLAWAIPGAGHIALRYYTRGIIMFVAVSGLFVAGLYIGSIGVIDRVQAALWYYGQILTSPAVALIAKETALVNGIAPYPVYGRPFEIGQIYTSIAGALNLLCIVNAMYIAYTGKQQPAGDEK